MREVKQVKMGKMVFGDGTVRVQSMLSVPSSDRQGSVKQAVELEKAGCEIIRAAIPNEEAVGLIPAIKEAVSVPLVADIHFDYRLAIASIENGADKIRINPGNIGNAERVQAVVDRAKERNIPIRVGVNSGSLEKELLEKINSLGIGPGGLGGRVTAFAVNIETYPTHIAGMPLAVNICCHVNRHAHRVL